jgi:hypothetical protein
MADPAQSGTIGRNLALPVSIQQRRSAEPSLRLLCPNGHLGFAPIKPGSFAIGCGAEPM